MKANNQLISLNQRAKASNRFISLILLLDTEHALTLKLLPRFSYTTYGIRTFSDAVTSDGRKHWKTMRRKLDQRRTSMACIDTATACIFVHTDSTHSLHVILVRMYTYKMWQLDQTQTMRKGDTVCLTQGACICNWQSDTLVVIAQVNQGLRVCTNLFFALSESVSWF